MFLILGCVTFVFLLLIILSGTDVREKLFRMDMIKNSGLSPEEIIRNGETTYGEISKTFKVMMASIGITLLIVGGIAFHDLRNRLFSALALCRLHKKMKKVRREILHSEQEIQDLEAQLIKSIAEFDMASLREKSMLLSSESKTSGRPLTSEAKTSFWRGSLSPLLLILLALIIYVLLTGKARGIH